MADILNPTWDKAAGFVRRTLDGKPYRVLYAWNTREAFWTIGLSLDDGTELLRGVALRVGQGLMRKFAKFAASTKADEQLPPGEIVAIDTSGRDEDPGRDDLRNGKVQVVYLTRAELAARGIS